MRCCNSFAVSGRMGESRGLKSTRILNAYLCWVPISMPGTWTLISASMMAPIEASHFLCRRELVHPDPGKVGFAIGRARRRCGQIRLAAGSAGCSRRGKVHPLGVRARGEDGEKREGDAEPLPSHVHTPQADCSPPTLRSPRRRGSCAPNRCRLPRRSVAGPMVRHGLPTRRPTRSSCRPVLFRSCLSTQRSRITIGSFLEPREFCGRLTDRLACRRLLDEPQHICLDPELPRRCRACPSLLGFSPPWGES